MTVRGARTGAKIRTKTIWKNLNPVWNEKYEFEIVSPEGGEVQIEVWDEDYLSSDDFMGQLIVPLSELPLNETLDKWYTLQKKKDKDKIKGDIHLAFHYYEAKVRLCVSLSLSLQSWCAGFLSGGNTECRCVCRTFASFLLSTLLSLGYHEARGL